MLPEKSQGKVLQATVVAVGPGAVNQVIVSPEVWDPLIYRPLRVDLMFMFFFPERACSAAQREGRREGSAARVWRN